MKPDRSAEYTRPRPVKEAATAADWLRVAGEAKALIALLAEQLRREMPVREIDTHTVRRIERCADAFEALHNKRKPDLWT